MDKKEDKNYNFIIEYKNIKSISQICKELNVDYSNVIKNRTTAENIKKVSDELKKQIIYLYSNIIVKEVIK